MQNIIFSVCVSVSVKLVCRNETLRDKTVVGNENVVIGWGLHTQVGLGRVTPPHTSCGAQGLTFVLVCSLFF